MAVDLRPDSSAARTAERRVLDPGRGPRRFTTEQQRPRNVTKIVKVAVLGVLSIAGRPSPNPYAAAGGSSDRQRVLRSAVYPSVPVRRGIFRAVFQLRHAPGLPCQVGKRGVSVPYTRVPSRFDLKNIVTFPTKQE